MKVTCAAITDVGRVRELNEDNYFASDEEAFFLVADGMGGHAAGEVASDLAVKIISSHLSEQLAREDQPDPQVLLDQAIQEANTRIFAEAGYNPDKKGMGTTVVVALVRDGSVCIGHVGDSRAYVVRDEEIRCLTADHSWVNFQVMMGNMTEEQAKYHPLKNIITKALGIQEDVEVEFGTFPLKNGDYILLCSDGLTGMILDEDIVHLVHKYAPTDLDAAVEALAEEALDNGGEDNVTVVLVRYESDDEEELDDTQKIRYLEEENIPTADREEGSTNSDTPVPDSAAVGEPDPNTPSVDPPEETPPTSP
jgi:PPM family protein phosphatase